MAIETEIDLIGIGTHPRETPGADRISGRKEITLKEIFEMTGIRTPQAQILDKTSRTNVIQGIGKMGKEGDKISKIEAERMIGKIGKVGRTRLPETLTLEQTSKTNKAVGIGKRIRVTEMIGKTSRTSATPAGGIITVGIEVTKAPNINSMTAAGAYSRRYSLTKMTRSLKS